MATLNGPERLHFESNRLLSVNEDEIAAKKLSLSSEEDNDSYKQNWGFTLSDLYKLALTFYKDKAGKAVHLSYQDKLKLVTFTKQVTHGKFTPEIYPEVGYLDVIGNDRRQAWLALGDMSKVSAMAAFVHLLDQVCPLFKPYVEAHKRDLEEKERIRKEDEEKRIKEEENERLRIEEEARQKEQHKLDIQRRQIQEALNQQTYHQFRAYAEEQYPGNPEQQQVLIRQLQEQHYQQYMQQVYQQQLAHQKEQAQQLAAMAERSQEDTSDSDENQPGEASSEGEEREDMPPIAAASMWTRKDIKEFKDSIRKEGGESVIKVGHGETVTVRVPTHQDGTCLFWEFATDNYDIAFGVYFEWTISPSNAVSVHVSDSDEDEEEDEDAETKGDVEKGKNKKEGPPVDEIIPVYRRDCHEEVYAGSHVYPGRGIYLLKFDNSYSLWRSKTLYYRVYYTR